MLKTRTLCRPVIIKRRYVFCENCPRDVGGTRRGHSVCCRLACWFGFLRHDGLCCFVSWTDSMFAMTLYISISFYFSCLSRFFFFLLLLLLFPPPPVSPRLSVHFFSPVFARLRFGSPHQQTK